MKVLRMSGVVERTGLSRVTIWRRVRDNSFPKPVSLGSKAVGWLEAEVDEWIKSRVAARDERCGDGR